MKDELLKMNSFSFILHPSAYLLFNEVNDDGKKGSALGDAACSIHH
ncbi:MAG: hypothetical protein QOD00_2116 [Blastocatellia bacterium]|jgi:hypothetical protein|nr:hypothetical protein [Blastocatellia bacterium]